MVEIKINNNQSGIRIDKFLLSKYTKMRIINIQKFIKKKEIKVNSKKVNSDYILQNGDIIAFSTFVETILNNPIDRSEIDKFTSNKIDEKYNILITDNISGVLSTIKSRSQIISFQRISENELIEEYSEKGIDYEVGKVLSKITNDVSEGMKLIEEGYLLDIIDLVKDINYSFFTGSDPVIVFNEKGKFLLDIADRMYHQIFLDLLVLITNDRLYHLLGKYDEIVFKNNISSIGNIYDIPYQNTFKQMEKIIEYKQRVLYNVNLELLYMSLFVEMRKIND